MVKGHYLCRKIEIETTGDAVRTVACSCTSCQSCSASVFAIELVFPAGSLRVVKGEEHVKTFKGE
jgi:hypothetical protein